MKKFLVTVLLLVIPITLVFSGGASTQSPGTNEIRPVTLRFTIWSANAAHLEMLNGFAAAYKQQNPHVNVVFETLPFAEYTSLLTLQLAGSNPPDGGWLLEGTGPTFVESGVLADVRPYLSSSSEYDYNDFSQDALSLWVKGNSTYAIPFSTSPFILFYNKDLFERAGAPTPQDLMAQGSNNYTWDNLANSFRLIKERTGVYGFQGQNGEPYTARIWHTLVPFLRAYGTDAWNENGLQLTTPQAIQAISLYHSLIFRDRVIVPPGDRSDFFAGSAASTINQISRVPTVVEAGFNWDIAPLPGGPAGSTHVIGQAAVGIFNASRNKDEAIRFLAFMTNKENVTTMARFFPPARQSVLNAGALSSQNPDISASSIRYVEEGIAFGRVLPAHPRFPQLDLSAQGAFDRLWQPNANVESTMREISNSLRSFF
jgi:multiple sugar transport system substrate-binding protein